VDDDRWISLVFGVDISWEVHCYNDQMVDSRTKVHLHNMALEDRSSEEEHRSCVEDNVQVLGDSFLLDVCNLGDSVIQKEVHS